MVCPCIQVRCYEPTTGICVVRTDRSVAREVWVSLTFVTNVNGSEAAIRVRHNAGSTRTCRKAATQVLTAALEEMQAAQVLREAAAAGGECRAEGQPHDRVGPRPLSPQDRASITGGFMADLDRFMGG